MTRHFKLTSGDIVEFTSESQDVITSGITGRLIGITEGDGKTCFIFSAEGGDILRFYLDFGRRPVSRLLILLCSGLRHIRDHAVEIVSVKNDVPGQSRLRMRFTDIDDAVEAPYRLPDGYSRLNARRIEVILAALEYSETEESGNGEASDDGAPAAAEADGMSEATFGELGDHAPLVVGGLGSLPAGERSVTVHDTREVTLVRNYPLVIAVFGPEPCGRIIASEDDMIELIRDEEPEIISKTFLTKKEREAFKDGFFTSLQCVCEEMPRTYVIESREGVNAILELQAGRLVINEDEEY